MIWTAITPSRIIVNGNEIVTEFIGNELLTHLYKTYINDYPKFYKMDIQCKLSFIASELLLQAENKGNDRFNMGESRAVVLCNKVSSLHADSEFQNTIQHPDSYFPSPAVFVYTLPNITTGEIAIRNKYYGETSFFVLKDFYAAQIVENVAEAFCDVATKTVLSGWIDCKDENNFMALLFIVERENMSNVDMIEAELEKIKKDYELYS